MTNRSPLKIIFLLFAFCFSTLVMAADSPIIAAAASVKLALEEIRSAFQKEHGKMVRISYASSGSLTRQIQQNAPFELFLSANSQYVDILYQQHKTIDKGTTYALGRLALLTTRNSRIPLDEALEGIKQAYQNGQIKRFAIANPEHAPYGIAAREVLQEQALWEQIKPHLVLGENAAQATQFISSGAAQSGLTSYSLALAPALQNRTRFLLIPARYHQPLQQTAVLLNHASDTAKLFFNYLQQDKARRILLHYGYSLP